MNTDTHTRHIMLMSTFVTATATATATATTTATAAAATTTGGGALAVPASIEAFKAQIVEKEGATPGQTRLVFAAGQPGPGRGPTAVQIFVKTLGGKTIAVAVVVEPIDTVEEAKARIDDRWGVVLLGQYWGRTRARLVPVH